MVTGEQVVFMTRDGEPTYFQDYLATYYLKLSEFLGWGAIIICNIYILIIAPFFLRDLRPSSCVYRSYKSTENSELNPF